MSEARSPYLLNSEEKQSILTTELDTLHAQLPDLERLLISLLVKVQIAQGKEPTVQTRAERRRG